MIKYPICHRLGGYVVSSITQSHHPSMIEDGLVEGIFKEIVIKNLIIKLG
jgi:hypothetical protein